MTRQEHLETTLATIAARVAQARASTNHMGVMPRGEGEALLCDLEHYLVSLVTLVNQDAELAQLEARRRALG